MKRYAPWKRAGRKNNTKKGGSRKEFAEKKMNASTEKKCSQRTVLSGLGMEYLLRYWRESCLVDTVTCRRTERMKRKKSGINDAGRRKRKLGGWAAKVTRRSVKMERVLECEQKIFPIGKRMVKGMNASCQNKEWVLLRLLVWREKAR
jgi:hypothetical protein